jgi:prevent-host-death family protein
MKKMAAGSFKANCLAVMDEVQAKHETVVITKRGKPVAKLVPLNTETDEIYNFLAGKGTITGDIVSPAISPDEDGCTLVQLERLQRIRKGQPVPATLNVNVST